MEKQTHPYDSYFHMVLPALKSKVEEFHVFGYDTVTEEELWLFLKEKKWKKYKEGIRVYELVSDILSASVGEYMNYATVEAFKSSNLFSEINEEELKELLGQKGV